MKFGKLLGAAVLLILLINKIPSSFAQANLEIKLKNRTFVPQTRGAMRVEGSKGTGKQHVILQFAQLPDAETLAQYGIKPLNYIPDNAIMPSVPAGFDRRNAPGVRWMGQLLPADKISAEVSEQFARLTADHPFTLTVESHSDVSSQTLQALVASAGGAFDTHPNLPGHVGLVSGTQDVFQKLAQDERVTWIMAASDELINGEPVYYCPGPLTELGPVANYVVHDNGWDGPGLGPASLTYHFINSTPDISGLGEEQAVRDALATWAKYADLAFSETNTAGRTRSLDILWASGAHGDSSPFDGPSGVLAHTFYPAPPNPETIGGDMHFDEAENWSLNSHIHMYAVALHEAGHALGLAHSNVSNAVMAPVYAGPLTDLHPDDIAGIRAIYSDSGIDAPSTPSLNSIANGDGDGSYNVSWSSVANATGYNLQEQQDSSSWSPVYNGSGTSLNINGRGPGEYCYRVLASNSAGGSAWSNIQCTTVTSTPTVQFTQSAYSVDEAAGSVGITVSLNQVSAKEVTVAVETSNGSAKSGDDYEYTSETLTIAPGDTEQTFSVVIAWPSGTASMQS